MALSDRARKKSVDKARTLLPPGTAINEYVTGRANARLSTGAIVAVAVFGLAFVVALALGVILIPGGLLLFYVMYAVRPPRGLVVATEGIAVLEGSLLNGRPTRVRALIPGFPPLSADGRTLDVGDERVTLTGKEATRLRAALERPWATVMAPSYAYR